MWIRGKPSFRGDHTTTFPYEITETCSKAGTRIGDLVLDPFAGSGMKLEEAVKLIRISKGFELNGRYVKKLIVPSLSKVP